MKGARKLKTNITGLGFGVRVMKFWLRIEFSYPTTQNQYHSFKNQMYWHLSGLHSVHCAELNYHNSIYDRKLKTLAFQAFFEDLWARISDPKKQCQPFIFDRLQCTYGNLQKKSLGENCGCDCFTLYIVHRLHRNVA